MARALRYVSPQLAQCVSGAPNAAYAIERLSKGYNGPVCKVRRASDSATQDCYSQADISTFCAGTNGFIDTWYDQTGNGRAQVQAGPTAQPKVFDSATGLLKRGATPIVTADGVNDCLQIAGSTLGFVDAAPAMTFALLTKFDGTLAAQSGTQQVGVANSATFYGWQVQARADLTQWVPRWAGLVERFTPNPAVNTYQYIVTQIALNANGNTLVVSTNGNALTNATPGSGTPAINIGSGASIFCEMSLTFATTSNFYLGSHAAIVYYNSVLAAADLAALKQYLERMRVQ